jgi:hypothetical protein
MANGNGRKVAMWAVTVLISVLTGATGMAFWMGGQAAVVEAHVSDTLIHEAPTDKTARIHEIVDRELWPMFKTLQDRLDRIDGNIDEIKEQIK